MTERHATYLRCSERNEQGRQSVCLMSQQTVFILFYWCSELKQMRALIQLFRERLSEKVHATVPKGIVGGFEFTVIQRSLKE